MDLNPIIISGVIALTGAVIVLYLRDIRKGLTAMNQRIDQQDARITLAETKCTTLAEGMANCKVDCHREFIPAESFIRSEAFTRKKLDKIVESFAALEGELKIAARIPEMIGTIVREVVANLNKGNPND